MELNEIFGLPAHPLLVHAAVVLMPIAAVGLIALALRPGWRRTYGPIVVVFALASLVSIGLAQGSGEQLEHRVEETKLVEAHTDEGERVMPWAIAVFLLSAATVGAAPLAKKYPGLGSKAVGTGLAVLGVVAAAGAIFTVVEVGHSGAKAAWDDLPAASADHDGD